ncbi:hypothetical protein [Amycolatopsis anabasis]|uniref:hypothetical protein n=1 Tax=Amycolatopsis anabasis TaxID=1840409 RepID=UPI00131A9FA2|nr:hypothetical protein [Amycolatopsis anabasis]
MLSAATALIDSAAPEDVAGVLAAVRNGLIAARRCGLAAAGEARWTSRHRNAEAVEFAMAQQLVRAPTLATQEIVLADPPDVTEHLRGPAADAAVEAITGFSRSAEQALRTAADHTQEWADRRVCRHCTALARELREAWGGQHPSYQLRPAE